MNRAGTRHWLALAAGLIAGVMALDAAAETRLRVGVGTAPMSPEALALKEMARIAAERSKGELVIEVDGGTHFGGGAEHRDALRTERMNADGYRVVRVLNSDVMSNLEGVMEYLMRLLVERSSP